MMILRILAAAEIDGIAYAADQAVAFADDQGANLIASGVADAAPTATIFVEHAANLALRGLEAAP